jgi:hypothetical protein
MKVITAIYLNCRPELRDEWLGGTDQETELEDAMVCCDSPNNVSDNVVAARTCITTIDLVLQQNSLRRTSTEYLIP